jgi:hypothetical protein
MRRLCVVLFATILWGCAAAALPERKPALDPANPDAPESKPLPIPTALAPPEPESSGEPDARQHEPHHEHGESR